MKWPERVTAFLNGITPFVEIQSMIVQFDCMIDGRVYDEHWNKVMRKEDEEFIFEAGKGEMRITYMKLIMYTVLPVICGVASYTVWYVVLTYKKSGKEDIYSKFIATFVILLFLVHPQITNYSIDMLNCKKYDTVLRMVTDP